MPVPRLAASAAAAAAATLMLAPTALAAPGDLDASFGVSGKLDFRFVTGETTWLADAVAASDGSLVAVGTTAGTGSAPPALALARFDDTGTRDTTFGDGGLTTVTESGYFLEPVAAARASDGKLLVAGNRRNDDMSETGLFVARFDTGGDLDTTFSDDGILTREVGTGEEEAVSDLAIDGDGRLVIGAAVWGPSEMDGWFTVLRLTAAGAADTTFGTSGEARMDAGTEDAPLELAIEADDEILAVAGGFDSSSRAQFMVVKLTEAGALDSTFGTNGLAATTFGTGVNVWPSSLSLDGSGRAVVAGQGSVEGPTDTWTETGAFARFTTSGALDTTFDSDGMATAGSSATPLRVRVAPDGKIVFAGSAEIGSGRGFAVGRLVAGGALDTTFASTGMAVTSDSSANAWVLEIADGHAVAAGTVSGEGRMYRYALTS